METNRMMSPAARRLAAVVLAALLCLSLFWPRGGSLTAVLCGAPLASELARQGWAVCINYREREDCARSLVEQLTGEGCRVMAVQAEQ